MENMELDGEGYNYPGDPLHDDSNHPQEPTSAPSLVPTLAATYAPATTPDSTPPSAQAYAPTPTVEKDVEMSGNATHVQEEPLSLHAQDPSDLIPAASVPISVPVSAPTYALPSTYVPTSAPTSDPISATSPTIAPTIEKDGDGYYSSNMSDVSLGESFSSLPQPPTSAPVPSIPSASNPSDPDPGFVDNERFNHADTDSAYDSDSFLSDTTSLNSEVTQYRIEHGRQYHGYKDGAYWGPNDERANEVQDLASHMYYLTLDNKLHLAPIAQQPHNILDVGTGTGIWAMDMADQYPSAVVTGVDLSPIQPGFVPPNCVFEVDDVTQPWTYPPKHFDFVHIREMFGSIPDWDGFFHEVYRCTKPGGWVEIVEHAVEAYADDASFPPDHFYHEWTRELMACSKKMGKTWDIWKQAKEHLLNAGFVDVVEVPFKWPMNGWPSDPKLKKIGRFNQYRLNDGCEGFVLRLLTNVGGWSYERAQLFVMQFRKHIRDYSCHTYLPGNVVYGRRPPERYGR